MCVWSERVKCALGSPTRGDPTQQPCGMVCREQVHAAVYVCVYSLLERSRRA